jgi:hypothetical protein
MIGLFKHHYLEVREVAVVIRLLFLIRRLILR